MNEPLPLAVVLVRQRECWQRGARLSVEDLLAQHPHLAGDENAVLDLIYGERVLREETGEEPALDEYLARFPRFAAGLRVMFEVDAALTVEELAAPTPHLAVKTTQPSKLAPLQAAVPQLD